MSQLMFTWVFLANSSMFFSMKHPMAMGISLLIQTAITCLIVSGFSLNTRFSYILFLVFLGGMLVLFIYMTSVASNELFKKSNHYMLMLPLTIMILPPMVLMDPMLLCNNTQEMNTISQNNSDVSLTTSMFNYPNNIMTIAMVLYLFITLIIIVKITESHQGPLRSKN